MSTTINRSCIYLNGTEDYLDAGEPLSPNGGITVEAWVKNDLSGGIGYIVTCDGLSDLGYSLCWNRSNIDVFLMGYDHYSYTYYRMLSKRRGGYAQPAPSDKLWHHIACTWDERTGHIYIYIDGKQQGVAGCFQNIIKTPSVNLNIGRSQTEGYYFKGSIAEVRVWNTARTESQIKEHKNRRLNGDESGLVGYWQLDGTVKDLQSNDTAHDLTKHGGTWTVDNDLPVFRDGEELALYFNGSSSYVDCGNNLSLTDAITVEAWVKHDLGDGIIVNCGGHGSDKGYSMFWYNNKIRVELQNSSYKYYDNPAPSDDVWHHIAFTWEKTTGTVSTYIDGRLQSKKGSFTESMGIPSVNLNIGRSQSKGYYFKGNIMDVRIWSVCKSADEIRNNMNNQLWGTEDNLIAYYKLNSIKTGDVSSAADSSSLGNDAAISDALWTAISHKPIAEAKYEDAVLYFDGADDYVLASPESSWSASAFTVEFWTNPASDSQVNSASFFNNHNKSTGTGSFQIDFDGSGNYRFNHNNGSYTIGTAATGWQHIAVTYDSSTLKSYINGKLKNSYSALLTTEFYDYVIGRNRSADKYFEGKIAEMRIWNTARSADEIYDNMYRYMSGTESGLKAYFKLNKGYSAATASLTAGKPAVISGAAWTSDTSLVLFEPDDNICLKLDGSNDQYVAIDNLKFLLWGQISEITVEAWVKTKTDSQAVIVCWDRKEYFSLSVGNDASGEQKRVYWSTKSSSGIDDMIGNTVVADGQWHHIAVSYKSGTGAKKIYVDGVLDKEIKAHLGEALVSGISRYVFIGNGSEAGEFNGSRLHTCIDDVRIWNKERSIDEIKANFGSGLWGDEEGLIGWWTFERFPYDGTVEDSSERRNNGTLIGGAYVVDNDISFASPAPKRDAVLYFNGTSDYIDCGSSISITDAITVEAWVRSVFRGGGIVDCNGGGNDAGYSIELNGGKIRVILINSSYIYYDNPEPSDHLWHHIAFTWEKTTGTISTYIDGELQSNTGSFTESIGTPSVNLNIGRRQKDGEYFRGFIADVRIWNTARTADQIKTYMNNRLWGSEDNLVAYYKLNSGKYRQTKAYDSTGNYDADVFGTTWESDSSLSLGDPIDPIDPITTKNPVLSFNGTSDYIDCGSSISITDAITVEAWVKHDSGNGIIVNCGGHGSDKGYSMFWYGRKIRVELQNSSYKYYDNPAPSDEVWHHIAFTWEKTTGTVWTYIDGKLQSNTGSFTESMGTPSVNLNIGRSQNKGYYFKGCIADVRIWNIARSAEEIKSYMNSRLWGTEHGLVGYWKLDEEGGTAKDSAGSSIYNKTAGKWETSGNDGVVYGATMVSSSLQLAEEGTCDPGSISSSDLNMAGDATIQNSIYIQDILDKSQSGWLADRFSSYTLPKWLNTLIGELEGCLDKRTGKFNIETDSFSEFSLFALIDDLRVADIDIIEIDNARLNLIGLGVDANDGVFNTYDVALSITGKATFLGLISVDVELRFYTGTDGKKIGVVMLSSSGSMSVSELLGGNFGGLLDILGDINIADPAIGFTTNSLDESCFSDDQYPFELGIKKGLNFYGTLDFSDSGSSSNPSDLEKVISFFVGLLGLDSIRVWGAISKNTGTLNMMLYLVLETDLTIIKGNSFEIKFHSCKIQLSLAGVPPEPSISVTNTLSLTLDYIGADKLLLAGTIKGEVESLTSAYTLKQGPGREKVWHPFNYSGISVESLAIQFGATYLAPWVDNFGMAANNVKVGDTEGNLAILIDTNDPDQFVFYLTINKISLMDIINVLCPLVDLSSDVKDILSELLNVSVTDLKLKIIPAACYIGDILYDDTGVTVAGNIDAWGWNAILDMNVTTGAVDLYAAMDELSVEISDVTVLSISGYEGQDNPLMKFYLGIETENFVFYISGSVTFLGITQQLYIKANSSKLNFLIDHSSSGFDTNLSVTFGKTSGIDFIAMTGYVEFNLNITVPTAWGDIRLSDISLTSHLSMDADTSPSFSLSTYGGFDFWGSTLKIGSSSSPVTLPFSVPPSSISEITGKIEDYIIDNAEDIFSGVWGTLMEWANAVADGVIWFGDNVADVAKDVYRATAEAAAAAYKALGKSGEAVAKGLSDAYSATEDATASAMKSAGYAAKEVASGLSSAYNTTGRGVASAMQSAGYAAEEVASAMKSAGYAAEEVADGLSSAFEVTELGVASAMKAAGYAAEEVASAMKSVGYPVNVVGNVMKDAYGLGEDAVGDVLNTAGYVGEEIQDFMDDVFDCYWDWTPYVDAW